MAGISIAGAAQVLRPPTDGLAYLRHDRAGELVTAPGALTVDGAAIAAFEASRDAPIQIDASGCAVHPRPRRLPHPPAVRRLASTRVRAEDRRRPVRADRRGGRRDQVLGEILRDRDRRGRSRSGRCCRRGDARARDHHVRVQERLRAVGRRRGSLAPPRRRARANESRRPSPRPRSWRTRCRTAMTPTAG